MNSTKNNQQRRLFTASRNVGKTQQRMLRLLQGHTRHFGRWLAIAAAVLLCSCASLTPDRLALILDLVGSAAQVGIQLWLQAHPGQRPAVEAVLAELAGLSARGTPPTEAELSAVMRKLPDEAWTGKDAEIYFSGTNIVNVWDSRRLEVHSVEAKSVGDVVRTVRMGMRAGMAPVAPLPVRPSARMVPASTPPTILYVTNQQVILIQQPDPVAPPPVVESPRRSSVVDFKMANRTGIYVVEKKEGTNWVEVSSFTSRPAEFRVRLR